MDRVDKVQLDALHLKVPIYLNFKFFSKERKFGVIECDIVGSLFFKQNKTKVLLAQLPISILSAAVDLIPHENSKGLSLTFCNTSSETAHCLIKLGKHTKQRF